MIEFSAASPIATDINPSLKDTSGSSFFSQSAWFRYHNKDKKIPNLYFSAAGSHPGAGIPGVLCSAKVIEKLIIKDFKVSH